MQTDCCSSCPSGWSQTILEVKMLDVEVLGWCGYTWSEVVRLGVMPNSLKRLWKRLMVEKWTFNSRATALEDIPAVSMLIARSLKTCAICGIVLCDQTAHFNDPLWLTLFMEGVNVRLLDHCQVSSLPHYCGFKEQEIPGIYTVGMVIYWNSNVNILIFWDIIFTDLKCRLPNGRGRVLMAVLWNSQSMFGVSDQAFQTCCRTHSGLQPVVDWPQCWRLGSCSWWWLSGPSTLM